MSKQRVGLETRAQWFWTVLANWATDEERTPWVPLEKRTLTTLFSLKYLYCPGKQKHTACRKAKTTCHVISGQGRGWGGSGHWSYSVKVNLGPASKNCTSLTYFRLLSCCGLLALHCAMSIKPESDSVSQLLECLSSRSHVQEKSFRPSFCTGQQETRRVWTCLL